MTTLAGDVNRVRNREFRGTRTIAEIVTPSTRNPISDLAGLIYNRPHSPREKISAKVP
jgi:hypothetical protein